MVLLTISDSYDYIDLCLGLRLIYVSVTWAKNSFRIFDEYLEIEISEK